MNPRRSFVPAVELLEPRIVLASAAIIDLSALNGASGFAVEGTGPFDSAGESMRPIGDFNGDGLLDFAVGADQSNEDATLPGKVVVVFGSASGYPAKMTFDDFDGNNGFVAVGASAGDIFGDNVNGADVNGDGFSDLVVGAVSANSSGSVYVFFGGPGPHSALFSASSLNGSNGFRIDGSDNGFGRVGNPGDVNDDGIQDLILGAALADSNGTNSGSIYVVFGRAGSYSATLAVSTLNGTNGFRVDGAASDDRFGDHVNSGFDLNNDGIDDIAIGAPGSFDGGTGKAYVLFGSTGAFSATSVASSLSGTNGFSFSTTLGERIGRDMRSAGDINGDSIDDLIIGTRYFEGPGRTYAFFGKSGAFAANVDVGTLDGSKGFLITGERSGDGAGSRVSGIGDFNGDGIGDVAVGSSLFDFNRSASGATYIVLGKDTGFAAEISLAELQLGEGFRFYGAEKGDRIGFDVSGAGDLNGDGFDDLLIGGANAKRGGEKEAGVGYVVFGFDSRIVPGKKSLQVMDPDGDMVSVSLKGSTIVPQDIRIGEDGMIASIDISRVEPSPAKGGKLLSFILKVKTPKNSEGDGMTRVGRFDAPNVKLGKVFLQADVGQINIGNGDAKTKSVTVLGNLGVEGMGASNFGGFLKKLKVGGDVVGTDIVADRVGKGIIDGAVRGSTLLAAGLAGSLKVHKGLQDSTIRLNAKTNALVVLGDIENSFVRAKDSLAILQVQGDVIDSTISALGAIEPASLKKSMAIKNAKFNGDFLRSNLLAGYDQNGNAVNADAGIGSVSIRKRFEGSNIVAGATAGPNSFFGDVDDQLIVGGTDVVAMIKSVKISGNIAGSGTEGDHFGIVAEQIGRIQVGGSKEKVQRGPGNDTSIPLGDTPDVKAREVMAPSPT